ncbi:hypothetical protein [Candidatus Thalassolituus haligoni]|uniref:hypothetical protein n=1 Tax=Candidatus Thalassolituus haligoni TaxID=3100113 RepID=UPI003519D3E0
MISNTPKATLLGDWRDDPGNPVTEQQLEDWHVLFEQDGVEAIRGYGQINSLNGVGSGY